MHRVLIGSVPLGISLLLSCANSSLPGTLLGTYSVVGTSTGNTCGSGVDAPNPWDFTVQMSKDGDTLYWSWMDDNAPVDGQLDSNASTTITASNTSNVDATDAGAGPCTMERDDSLTIDLADGGVTPGTFTGSISYSFKVTSGSVCADQLAVNGGTYDTLPCAMSYSLAGTKQ